MKKTTQFTQKYLELFLFFSLLFHSGINAQVKVPFTPRTAQSTPGTSIYHIKGDFSLIGNTNLTLVNYNNNTNNSNNSMQYVDVDNDNSTFNSSTSELIFSTENGAVPDCSRILFAGLYWTGRSSDNSTSPDTFTVTKNGQTKTFDKRKVSIKGPNSSNYTEITANTNDIYYPNSSDGLMYSAFAEITDYVKLNGLGNYTVADIALVEGNGGSTGYYGGWGLVVVYENSKMKWRDVTIFDGHAYVQGNTTVSHQIPISGFNAVQTGSVNIKLGLMAGEGDVGISGDYFNILRSSDNNWQTLNHNGNSSSNFFNSSIQTGGNFRNPNLQINTGLDISMFDIPNNNNSVIANNQTSTTLRYGSTQDTYIIFMAAFAVDAYIPDAEGVMSLITINGNPPSSNLTVLPGEEVEYSIKILNEGTEAINNAKLKIEIPYTANFVSGSEIGTINFSPLPTPNNLYFDQNLGGNGTIIWDIGTLPVPSSPTDILGELKYKIKITEDCFLLKNPNCSPSTPLYGYLSGIGAVSGFVFNDKPFIQGYQTTGQCIGDPITDPIILDINSVDYVNQNCQNVISNLDFKFCDTNNAVSFNQIASNYPNRTKFYDSYPVTSSSIEYTSTNNFPSLLGTHTYYAVPPLANGCYFIFTITFVDEPTITTTNIITIDGCSTADIPVLPYSENPVTISLQDFINSGGSVSNNSLGYNITYQDIASGTCPIKVVRKFTISSICSTIELNQNIVISDSTAPVFVETIPADLTVECNAIPTPATITATDNCDASVVVNYTETSTQGACANAYTLVRTWSATDACGNTSSASQTITVQDTTAPVLITEIEETLNVTCSEIGVPPILEFVDNCSDSVNVIFNETITTINTYEYILLWEWTANDDCGNETTVSQTINITNEIPAELIPYSICVDDEPLDLFTILDNSIPTNGEWIEITNSGGLSGNIFNPTNILEGFYTLQYIIEIEENYCPLIYEVYLNVNSDCIVLPACDIIVYNAVSPNNDGMNDYLIIDGIECYPNNSIEIYNRWGILVYETQGYDNLAKSFKGYSEGRTTFNKNELLPDGTYFYILKYTDAENKTYDKSGYLYLDK